MPADDFIWPASRGTKGDTKLRVLTSSFGDGYRSKAADGPNPERTVYPVLVSFVDTATADAIEAFLRSKGGYQTFLWTPPSPPRTQRKWTCASWSWTPTGPLHSLSATFEEEHVP